MLRVSTIFISPFDPSIDLLWPYSSHLKGPVAVEIIGGHDKLKYTHCWKLGMLGMSICFMVIH